LDTKQSQNKKCLIVRERKKRSGLDLDAQKRKGKDRISVVNERQRSSKKKGRVPEQSNGRKENEVKQSGSESGDVWCERKKNGSFWQNRSKKPRQALGLFEKESDECKRGPERKRGGPVLGLRENLAKPLNQVKRKGCRRKKRDAPR